MFGDRNKRTTDEPTVTEAHCAGLSGAPSRGPRQSSDVISSAFDRSTQLSVVSCVVGMAIGEQSVPSAAVIALDARSLIAREPVLLLCYSSTGGLR